MNELKELLRVAGKSISKQSHPYSESPETFEYKGQMICVAPAGDTSYLCMLIDENRLLLSYYSSHISYSDIFIAEIPLECLISRGIIF